MALGEFRLGLFSFDIFLSSFTAGCAIIGYYSNLVGEIDERWNWDTLPTMVPEGGTICTSF